MDQATIVKQAADSLKKKLTRKNIVVGFDGFVDEIIHVVEERQDVNTFTRVETISDFSQKLAKASGLSANIEFFPIQTKLGGNGPILANALVAQKHAVSYIGAIGDGTIDPLFATFASECQEVITMAAPGHTDALEFNDGKIMFGKTSALLDINWEKLLSLISREKLQELVANADLLAFTNWMELPHFNSLLIGFNEILKETQTRPAVFIDLADPARRTDEDIRTVCHLIAPLQENADVLFGLNESESIQIARVYGIDESDFCIRAEKIRNAMNITAIVIHPLAGASVAVKDASYWIDGPYTKKPKLTTGAGDNFNSGFCNAWLAGLSPEECLAVGVCTSGFYVRECRSPSQEDLIDFMGRWAQCKCGDI